MEFFASSGLINGLFSISFGAYVFLKNSKNPVNIVFLLMSIALSIWSFAYWQWMLSNNITEALFWVRIFSIGSIFLPIFFFHWVLLVINNKRHTPFLILMYLSTIVIFLFSLSPLFIASLEQKLIFSYWPNPGIIYSIYLAGMYIGLVLYAIYLLIKKYFKTDNKSQKGKILYVLFGSLIGILGGATNFFLWYDIPILPYGNFLVIFFPLFLGYSIVKHKLFSAKTISTEILVFFMLVILFAQALYSTTNIEFALRGFFLLIFTAFSYLLIKSVYKEVETREEIERLAGDLKKANVKLKELDKLKSEFVSIASHQLRSPLTAMKGYASLLLEGSYGKIPPAAIEAIENIFKSTDLMVDSVEDFLNVSRIEQGRMKYEISEFDIVELVRSVYEEQKNVADEKGIKLEFNGDGKINIKADIGKLKQVFTNIVDNSIKYTPKGTTTISVTELDDVVRFSVKDTGIGMSKEDIGKLFTRFSRAKGANMVNTKGTGLGLYVAKQMVEAHKGKIWAESEGKGLGSNFIVELPTV